MGCCGSKQVARDEHPMEEETIDCPLPIINPVDTQTSSMFDPKFSPQMPKTGESMPLLVTSPEHPNDVPEPKKEEIMSDDSEVDQDLISKLLAEVEASDTSE